MKTRIFEAVAVLVLLLPTVGRLALASPFYDFKIVAQTDTTVNGYRLATFKASPSINNNGRVAFAAVLNNSQGTKVGEGLFRGLGP